MTSRLIALCATGVMAASPCAAQTPNPSVPASGIVDVHAIDPHTYRADAVRLPAGVAPKIDGRPDDDVWQLARPFGPFIQREPVIGAPSIERTEFRVLYDDRKLYVAIWAFESHPGS